MFKKVLEALTSLIKDGIIFIFQVLVACIGLAYAFSGFGVLFVLFLLIGLNETTIYSTQWVLGLIGILIIASSWILFLVLEILKRIKEQEK